VLLISVIFIFGILLLVRTVIAIYMGTSGSVPAMWREFFGLFSNLSKTQAGLNQDNLQLSSNNKRFSGQDFLFDCYLFLFGQGNPNKGVDDERWKLIAQAIRLNEGIVVAEHLSPYSGRPPEDNAFIFATLAKFNGYPKVTENNEIAYVFPSLSLRTDIHNYAHMPAMVKEQEWPFMVLSKEAARPVVALATANLLGACFLLFSIIAVGGTEVHHMRLFLFFAMYGALFFLIPLVRWCINGCINQAINRRNQIAECYERKIGNPDPPLLFKLEEAERLRRAEPPSSDQHIVYRTDKDCLDQSLDR
jgi:hypothetical protein